MIVLGRKRESHPLTRQNGMASLTRTVSWPSHETSFVLTFWKGYGPQAILGLVLELGGMSGQGGRHGVRRGTCGRHLESP